jgi:hypothetical protein
MSTSQQLSDRQKRLAARQADLRARTPRAPMLRVEPTSDDYRKYLTHPRGRPFPEGSGSVEWPADRFTRRRIAEGAVRVVETGSKPQQHQPHAQRQRGSEAT